MSFRTVTIELTELESIWLDALTRCSDEYTPDTVEGVISTLVAHAADGVRRPGAWERSWIEQVFPLDEDPAVVVHCEHDWKRMGPDNPLERCIRCFTYRRKRVDRHLAVHTWLRSTLADRTEVPTYHDADERAELDLDKLLGDASVRMEASRELVDRVFDANAPALLGLWLESLALAELGSEA